MNRIKIIRSVGGSAYDCFKAKCNKGIRKITRRLIKFCNSNVSDYSASEVKAIMPEDYLKL